MKHSVQIITEPGLIDHAECSCGWKSAPYFDGREYAMADYRKHVQSSAVGKPVNSNEDLAGPRYVEDPDGDPR